MANNNDNKNQRREPKKKKIAIRTLGDAYKKAIFRFCRIKMKVTSQWFMLLCKCVMQSPAEKCCAELMRLLGVYSGPCNMCIFSHYCKIQIVWWPSLAGVKPIWGHRLRGRRNNNNKRLGHKKYGSIIITTTRQISYHRARNLSQKIAQFLADIHQLTKYIFVYILRINNHNSGILTLDIVLAYLVCSCVMAVIECTK